MSDKPVVFFHVMKCGGTSVRVGLTEGAAGHRHGPDVFELQGQIAIEAVGGRERDNWQFRDSLLLYVLMAMDPTVVLGHFRYRDRFEDYIDRAHFVTVLRDPVDRFVSLYKYRRFKDGVDVAVAGPFEEFIASTRWRKEGHAYVDLFCGRDDIDPHTDEAVDAAFANLRRFAVVGFTDRLDEFAAAVSARIGKDVHIPRLNESPAPLDGDGTDIDAGLLEQAREVCAPDLRLYEQLYGTRP